MTSETPSSSARRMSAARLVRSRLSRILRPMPVIGCCRIRASSDDVKVVRWLFIPTHVLASSSAGASPVIRTDSDWLQQPQAYKFRHVDFFRILIGLNCCTDAAKLLRGEFDPE